MDAVQQMEAEMAKERELAERREIYKNLRKYEVSDEFKTFSEWCDEREKERLEDVRDELETREKPVAEYSLVDERLAYIRALNIIKEQITNEHFKTYIEKRIEAHISFCENRAGEDQPIYTKLDIIKFERQEFWNIKHYIEFCISSYDDKEIGEEDE